MRSIEPRTQGSSLMPGSPAPSSRMHCALWASNRLNQPVTLPDLSASGYRYMGGRVVATPHGPGMLLMYDDDRGTRLVMLTRPMAVDRDTPMAQHGSGTVAGFAWADRGIGYSLVGPLLPDALHPIADEVPARSIAASDVIGELNARSREHALDQYRVVQRAVIVEHARTLGHRIIEPAGDIA
jgi:anti-sigma factor RsiW